MQPRMFPTVGLYITVDCSLIPRLHSKACLYNSVILYEYNPEEVGHGHVTGYVVMKLYGFSMELHACTKIVWPSFGKAVLSSLHNKRILLESACKALSEKRVNPVQLLGDCGATVLKLSIHRQGWITDVDSIDKQQDVALLGLYQLSYI